MKRLLSLFRPLLVLAALSWGGLAASVPTLHYTQAATTWTEALPLGNGRLGAMQYGGVVEERLQLNEATLWSGGPRNWNNPKALAVLPLVREAVAKGEYVKAGELCKQMQGPYNESYQPLGDLLLHFTDLDGPIDKYQCSLNLDTATSTVSFERAGVRYLRESFASNPDQVIVLQLQASQPGMISFDLEATSQLRATSSCEASNELADLPTNERLARFATGQQDPGLAALLFHYGRYLLISSSRPGDKDPGQMLKRLGLFRGISFSRLASHFSLLLPALLASRPRPLPS